MQLDRNNTPIRSYKLEGVWPTSLDAIDLSFEANDAIETFGATFRFNWMTAGGTGSGTSDGARNNTVVTVGATYSSDF